MYPQKERKKSSKLYWEGHLVGSTLNCMKIQQGNHGWSPKSKSEMVSNFKWLFMFPHKQVTREVCFNHNSATHKWPARNVFSLLCFSYSTSSGTIMAKIVTVYLFSFIFLSTFFSWKSPFPSTESFCSVTFVNSKHTSDGIALDLSQQKT